MEARLTGLLARLSYARGELDLAAQLFSQALASFGPDDPVSSGRCCSMLTACSNGTGETGLRRWSPSAKPIRRWTG